MKAVIEASDEMIEDIEEAIGHFFPMYLTLRREEQKDDPTAGSEDDPALRPFAVGFVWGARYIIEKIIHGELGIIQATESVQ